MPMFRRPFALCMILFMFITMNVLKHGLAAHVVTPEVTGVEKACTYIWVIHCYKKSPWSAVQWQTQNHLIVSNADRQQYPLQRNGPTLFVQLINGDYCHIVRRIVNASFVIANWPNYHLPKPWRKAWSLMPRRNKRKKSKRQNVPLKRKSKKGSNRRSCYSVRRWATCVENEKSDQLVRRKATCT